MLLKLAFDFSILEIRHAWRIGTISVASYLLSIFVFHIQSPQWVMLTAIVCSQVNLGSTMRKSKQRLIGTVIGCILGLGTEYLFAEHTFFLIGLFFLSFLIGLQFIVRSYTLYSAFFTYSFILMMFFLPSVGYNVAFQRIEDVVIGVLIGTLGSFVLWPDFASKMFSTDMIAVVSDMQGLFQTIIQWMNNEKNLDAVMQSKFKSFNSNQEARNRVSESYYEFGLLKYPVRKYEKFIISQERIHYALLLIVQSIRYAKELNPDENAMRFFVEKMMVVRLQYSELVRQIPNLAPKVRNMTEDDVKSVPVLVKDADLGSEIDQKLLMYLEKLSFELKEMSRAINEMIEYER